MKQGSAESGTSPEDSVEGVTRAAAGERSRRGSNAPISSEGRGRRASRKRLDGAESIACRTRSASKADSHKSDEPGVTIASDIDCEIVHPNASNSQNASEVEDCDDNASIASGSKAGSKGASVTGMNSPPARKRGCQEVAGSKSKSEKGQTAQKAEENEDEILAMIYDTSNPMPVSNTERTMKSEAEFAEEFRQQPTNDLAARLFDTTEVLRNIVYRSKNLSGMYQRSLKELAIQIKAATSVLSGRSQTSPDAH